MSKTTIQEVICKLQKIDHAIITVEQLLSKDCFPGQESLCDVIDLLAEYRDKIMDSKVDI